MAKPTRMTANTLNHAMGNHPAAVRRRVEAMEQLLERTFIIPGINRPIGLDVILDLIPVGGSFIGAILGLYMVWESRNLKMGSTAAMRMIGNVGIDWLLGLIPGIGIIPDFFFRSNSRNLKIIKKHLDKHHPSTATVHHD